MERYAALIGTGSYVPERVLTNYDLEKMVDTSDEWIRRRTGIVTRHVADEATASSDLGIEAARAAIKMSGVDPLEIELILVPTITPDMMFPSTACVIQSRIEAMNAGAVDLMAACAGFSYALHIADGLIRAGVHRTILVVATETLSKIVDWTDRGTCVLFGDAAGAAVLQASDEKRGILSSYVSADGIAGDASILGLPGGGSRHPATLDTVKDRLHFIKMQGREVFKIGVRVMVDAALIALEKAGLQPSDIDLFIPHQANNRIIEAVGERLTIPSDRVYINVDRYGNTSSATTIVALDEAIRSGLVGEDSKVLLVSFGGGFTWAGTVLQL